MFKAPDQCPSAPGQDGMSTQASADVVMRVRQVTGMPWHQIREFLASLSPSHRSKFLAAVSQQKEPTLYDPVEDDSSLASIFESVRLETATIVKEQVERERERHRLSRSDHLESMAIRGQRRLIWNTMQRLLRERHGIEWLTPVQMNPGRCFD